MPVFKHAARNRKGKLLLQSSINAVNIIAILDLLGLGDLTISRACPPLPSGLCSKRGSVLLEMMVSIILFTVGILAVIGGLPYLSQAEKITKQYTTAVVLAERYMEEIKSQSLSATSYNNLNTAYCDNSATRNAVSGYPGFYSCLQVVNNGNAELKKITVNIYWSVSGREKRFTLVNQVRRNY